MNRFVVTRLGNSGFVFFAAGMLWLFFGATSALAATTTSLVTLGTRASVTQKFILIKPDQPVGTVILFAGGNGVLNLQEVNGSPVINSLSGNFLVRTRQEYVNRGFMVAVVDAPSDHLDATGMDFNFRRSADHATDIGAVVAYLKNQVNVPVWLVGTSAGTTSAANNAILLGQNVSGVMLTSGLDALSFLNLATIQVPSFVLHHAQDACTSTTPAGAQGNFAALTGAPVKDLTFLTGGLPPTSGPCDAFSQHGFYGIETQAVDAIAAFIKAHSSMSVPIASTALACSAAGTTVVSADWQLARPLGITVIGSDAALLLQSAAFTTAVDVYLVIAIPGGQQFVVNAAGQLLPFPANTVPLRAASAAALSNVGQPLFSVPLTAIPPGSYSFYLVVVPAGTSPMSFSLASSPYYLWCFTRSF
jgi:hypothetical protein